MPKGVKGFQKGNKVATGRPKAHHTIEAAKAREYIIQRVTEELGPIMDNLIALAKAGDIAAIKDLLDRAYGKAKETMDVNQRVTVVFDE